MPIAAYADWDATEMAAQIAAGEATGGEVEEAVRRAETCNEAVNAIVHPLYD